MNIGEIITIELIVSQLKDSSFKLSYDCKNEKAELLAKVKTVHVFVDKKSWKKMEIDSEVLKGLEAHLNN
jgi:acyl-CoA thioesterase FadM